MANYELSNRIYELRKQKGLSQKELGAILGVSNKAVSKWETGTAIPKTETLIKIAEVFEISPEELLNFVRIEEEYKMPTLAELSDYTQQIVRNGNVSAKENEHSPEKVKKARFYLITLTVLLVLGLVFAVLFILTSHGLYADYGDFTVGAESNMSALFFIPVTLAGFFTGIYGFLQIAKKLPAWVCLLCGVLFLFTFGILEIVGSIMIIPFTVRAIKIIRGARRQHND